MKTLSIACLVWSLLWLSAPDAAAAGAPVAAKSRGLSVLVFSKTAGFRHESIPDGIAAITKLGKQNGWKVAFTEDSSVFNDAALAAYDVTVWLMTSRDVLDDEQQAAFQRYIRAGGGLATIHSGTDTEYDWPWYGQLLGGSYFQGHPKVQQARVRVENRDHPALASVPSAWNQVDEYYAFRTNPRAHVAVLLTVDEKTYEPAHAAMGTDHPIAWVRYFDGGRMFHTALGHAKENYVEEPFLIHITRGIEWAGGRLPSPGLPDNARTVLEEFDGVHPPGIWDIHQHPSTFRYEVRKDALLMFDRTVGYGTPNQHLTRRRLTLDPNRPYAIEAKVSIQVDGTEADPSSFCFNVNVAGADGELDEISSWSIPIDYHHQWPPSVMKFMGFNHGRFAQLSQRDLPWCRQNTEYLYRVTVNADAQGRAKPKRVSVLVKDGDKNLESTTVDYATFPYQPDLAHPVRLGVNTHGANWTMRNLRVFYLGDRVPTGGRATVVKR